MHAVQQLRDWQKFTNNQVLVAYQAAWETKLVYMV